MWILGLKGVRELKGVAIVAFVNLLVITFDIH